MEDRGRSINRILVIVLIALVIVGIGLGVGIFILSGGFDLIGKVKPRFEEVIADAGCEQSDCLSGNDALIFYNYMSEKLEDDEFDYSDVRKYYDELLEKASGDVKLSHLSYYADIASEEQEECDEAINLVKSFAKEAEDGGRDLLGGYYVTLRAIFKKCGHDEESAYYDGLLNDMYSYPVVNDGGGE